METRSSRNKKRRLINTLIGISVTIVLSLSVIVVYLNLSIGKQDLNINERKPANIKQQNEEIKLTSLGNILFHKKQLDGAFSDGKYDFTPSFKHIKGYMDDSDVNIGVLETSLLGENYSGYPMFNSPDDVLFALQDSNINVVNYATNHILDTGSKGVKRTMEVTKDYGLDIVGIRQTSNDKKYLIKEVDNHKIGIISYVYETPKQQGVRTINAIKIPNEVRELVNTFNYGELNTFYNDMKMNIDDMKKNGVEFIVVGVHWGEEYNTYISNAQREMAENLSELGVDIILGSHPHVIQPYETIVNSEGKKVFVSYSQGNFLSNQCYDEIKDYRTEDGIIINFILDVDKENKLYLKEYEVIPTWVHRYINQENKYSHEIVPVLDAIENMDKYSILEEEKKNLERSLKSTKEILKIDDFGLKDF